MKGWISLHRAIQNHWTWADKPFSKGQAWIDLIMMANHEDKKILLGNELILVKRGQRITSIKKLCDRWGWSNTKVTQYLKMLETDEMIKLKVDKKTLITIVKYDDYQTIENKKTSENRYKNDEEQMRKRTNNNDNNENNDNKKDIPYVEIIAYLNQKANKNYKATTNKNKELINARWNDGFRLEDFKQVIDIKTSKWMNTDMEQYLRPLTLFGNKFESYLNESKPERKEPDATDFESYYGNEPTKEIDW